MRSTSAAGSGRTAVTSGGPFGGRSGAGVDHAEVGGGGPEGFEVDTDDLARTARVLVEGSDVLLRAENSRAGAARSEESRSIHGEWFRRVPGWLDDYDRDWRARRDEVLEAHADAVRVLRGTAHTYLDGERQTNELIARAGTADDGWALPAPGSSTQQGPLGADAVGFPSEGSTSRRDSRPHVEVADTDLDTAVELWRRRRDTAGTAADMLRDALIGLRWHGPAATAFRSWTQTHLERCAALAEGAGAAHTALLNPDPTLPHLTSTHATLTNPLAAGPAQFSDPIRPASAAATIPASAEPGTAMPTPQPAEVPLGSTNHTGGSPAVRTSPTPPAVPEHVDALHVDALHVDARHLDAQPVDDEHVELTNAGPAPDRATVETHPTAPAADTATADEYAAHAPADRDAETNQDGTAAAVAAILPVAAIAYATLSTRADRAYHVISDLPYSPNERQPVQPSAPGGPSSSAAAQQGQGPQPTAPLDDERETPGRTAQPDGPARPLPPVLDTTTTVWINLARPSDPPAWINLAASRGLGLDGPGAGDIARTLWRRLRGRPDTLLIIPDETARTLLGSNLDSETERWDCPDFS